MTANTIMIQGTASDAGKSILVAALCRIFFQDGYRVAPFKSQNMSSYFYTTAQGEQMSIAQANQAEAAGLTPSVIMNPVLLKPSGQSSSQVVVLGKVRDEYTASAYHGHLVDQLWKIVVASLAELRSIYDIVVIEGAGSPAEVNLQANEIVNMRVAREADAPVLLVADVDRGGALASVVGTLELLSPDDRGRVKGIIINKFRGDVSLFTPAVEFLEQKTGLPVLGVIPYLPHLLIADEDTLSDMNRPVTDMEQGQTAPGNDYKAKEREYDRLADVVRRHLNLELVYQLLGNRA